MFDTETGGAYMFDNVTGVVRSPVLTSLLTQPRFTGRRLGSSSSITAVNDKLWVLNAGTGHLGWVDFENKAFVPHAFVPGFARGLSIIGNVAAVGLSKPRNQRFEGLKLDEELRKRDAEPWCGVQIISLSNGDVMNWIRFEGDISEIFDISFLPNVRNPMMIGLRTAEIRDLITFESDLPAEPVTT